MTEQAPPPQRADVRGRRRFPRFQVHGRIFVRSPDLPGPLLLVNVGGGGVLLLCRSLLEPGRQLTCEFFLPNDTWSTSLDVRVVHSGPVERPGTDDGEYMAGCAFLGIEEAEAAARVRSLLDHLIGVSAIVW